MIEVTAVNPRGVRVVVAFRLDCDPQWYDPNGRQFDAEQIATFDALARGESCASWELAPYADPEIRERKRRL